MFFFLHEFTRAVTLCICCYWLELAWGGRTPGLSNNKDDNGGGEAGDKVDNPRKTAVLHPEKEVRGTTKGREGRVWSVGSKKRQKGKESKEEKQQRREEREKCLGSQGPHWCLCHCKWCMSVEETVCSLCWGQAALEGGEVSTQTEAMCWNKSAPYLPVNAPAESRTWISAHGVWTIVVLLKT